MPSKSVESEATWIPQNQIVDLESQEINRL